MNIISPIHNLDRETVINQIKQAHKEGRPPITYERRSLL